MNVQVYTAPDSFNALKKPWIDLLARSSANTIFGTWQFQETWWRCFGEDRTLRLCVVSEDQRLMGIVPLMGLEGDANPRTLQLIGGTEVADYLDVIAEQGREQEVLVAALDAVEWDSLDLHVIPEASATRPALARLAEERGYRVTEAPEDVCPLIHLPATWDDYLATLTKKNRHELRRKMRRLEEEASTRVLVTRDIAALADDVDAFIALHRASEGRKGRFMDVRMTEFFHALSRVCFMEKWLHLAFLDVNGTLAATTLSFKYNNTLALYNSAYALTYQRLSPGLLLVASLIRESIADKLRLFDFLRGDEPYKYDLGGQNTHVWQVRVGK